MLGLAQGAYISRMSRSCLLEVIREDYVRTARAKGAVERTVVLRHALPNALLPVITISGVLLGFVLGGSVAVEQAFGVPGLGRALVIAIIERDIIVVQNLVLLYAADLRGSSTCSSTCRYAWLDPADPVLSDAQPPPAVTLGATVADEPPIARSRASSAPSRGAIRSRSAGGLVGALRSSWSRSPRPWIAPREPLKADFRRMNKPPDAQSFFGTDQVGRDTLSRVIYGARTSLFVAFSAVLLGTTVGSLWGVACGYLGGRFDLMSQRVMEILQAFPDLILAMAISMAIGTGLPAVIVAIAITRIPVRRARHPLGGALRARDAVRRGGARLRRLRARGS